MSGKAEGLKVGVDIPIEVADPDSIPTAYVDALVTGGIYDDTIHLTLGCHDFTFRMVEPDRARMVVVSKLRMNRVFAEGLWRALGVELGLMPRGALTSDTSAPPTSGRPN